MRARRLPKSIRGLAVLGGVLPALALAPVASASYYDTPTRWNASSHYWYQQVGSVALGVFQPTGEHLIACDNNWSDGRFVRVDMQWGSVRASDSVTAEGEGCQSVNKNIAEGTEVYFRTCVEGRGCTPWSGRVHA